MIADHGRWSTVSFSQAGEDRLMLDLFRRLQRNPLEVPGTYLDVGCYHPFKHSNTALLNLAGWRGVNLDLNAETTKLMAASRPEDINLTMAAGVKSGTVVVSLPAIGISATSSTIASPKSSSRLEEVEMQPLRFVIEKYMDGKPPDYLDIDVEGFELEVLKGLEGVGLSKLVSVEYHRNLKNPWILDSQVGQYMLFLGYKWVAATSITHFFIQSNSYFSTER